MSDSQYLQHYGILGQKWGVRRYQNPDGTLTPAGIKRYGKMYKNRDIFLEKHTLPAGTKVYRSTVNKNPSGATYVTYLQTDRNFYKGSYAPAIWKQQDPSQTKRLHEVEFELKENVTVPGRKEMQEVIRKVADEEFIKNTAKAQYDHFRKRYDEQGAFDEFVVNEQEKPAFKGREWNQLTSEEKKDIIDRANKTIDQYTKQQGKKFVGEFLKEYGNTPASELDKYYKKHVQAFGSSPQNKQKVIDELKKRGYNAMVDEAGVGVDLAGKGGNREGIDPLIIFDAEKSLKFVDSHNVTNNEMRTADSNYRDWVRKADQRRNQVW